MSETVALLSQWAGRYAFQGVRTVERPLIGTSHVKGIAIIGPLKNAGSPWYMLVRSHLMTEASAHIIAGAFRFPNQSVADACEQALKDACKNDHDTWVATLNDAMQNATNSWDFFKPMAACAGYSTPRHIFEEIYREFNSAQNAHDMKYQPYRQQSITTFTDSCLKKLRTGEPLNPLIAEAVIAYCPENFQDQWRAFSAGLSTSQSQPQPWLQEILDRDGGKPAVSTGQGR